MRISGTFFAFLHFKKDLFFNTADECPWKCLRRSQFPSIQELPFRNYADILKSGYNGQLYIYIYVYKWQHIMILERILACCFSLNRRKSISRGALFLLKSLGFSTFSSFFIGNKYVRRNSFKIYFRVQKFEFKFKTCFWPCSWIQAK